MDKLINNTYICQDCKMDHRYCKCDELDKNIIPLYTERGQLLLEDLTDWEQSQLDDNIEIDKCLNCGRYRATDKLNKDQVCLIPCRNPNEY